MSKELKDMTLEELWELFPIELVPHNPVWTNQAKQEIELLNSLLSAYNPLINHIGSTAITGIYAKPIVDILVEVAIDVDYENIKMVLGNKGYILMSESPARLSFNKGYTPQGFGKEVFHIHIHRNGDRDEILFRDFLCKNPNIAHEYELLKLSLLPQYKHNRDGYTTAKTDFIKKIMNSAQNSPSH